MYYTYSTVAELRHIIHPKHQDIQMTGPKAKFYFEISTSSGVPIYRQIIDQVKTHMATGRLKEDDFLPSVRQVALELEINPMTVSKAYNLLERDGILELARGQGMVVKKISAAKKDLRRRTEELIPLLREVVNKSKQLSLDPKDIFESFKNLWKEQSK